MKRVVLPVLIVGLLLACTGAPPPLPPLVIDDNNPGTNPELVVKIPDLFSPNPDIVDDTMTVSIKVVHPVAIRDWDITVQAMRQRLTTEQLAEIQTRRDEQAPRQRTREIQPFYELIGTGTPPAEWVWNGRSSSRHSAQGEDEMVQSATAYQFALYVNDIYGNHSTYEGVIEVDVIVRKDGDKLRIVVPSITFQADSSNFSQPAADLTEEVIEANRRVLRLIANALDKYPGYKITIEGHANPVHSPNSRNQRNAEPSLKTFSESRARAVGVYLTENHGIDSGRFTYIGVGSDRVLVSFNEDAEEKWKNRRVEFILDR